MRYISGYEIVQKISETPHYMVYRGRKEGLSQPCIVKVLKTKHSSKSEVARFKQEYNIIRNIKTDGIIRTYDIIDENEVLALILEDFDGTSIKDILETQIFDISLFLKIAIQLSKTLGELHNEKIIHMDIKPQNIRINLGNNMVKIADFGIASIITHENDEIYNPEIIEGTLVYMSPEQTGRMNRTVDYRTDLYSLGVTFYEMLTGQVPFESHDPLEIMHGHIAREPVSPFELNSGVPEIVSEIIVKLLSKKAENRYQNSFGLMADLKECLKRLDKKGGIDRFEHSRKDIPIKFQIPELLVGREKEVDILMNSFDRIAPSGEEFIPSQLMLVSGNPGIGKSALINEIHRPIIAKRGCFISGKFDQFGGDVPYSAIVQAFQGLVRQILAEGEERINIRKENLQKAFGTIGKVITDVIPLVSLITGEQPDVPVLGGEESMNRFNYGFKRFVEALAGKDHPLVFFLDDLQWADPASLKLIEILITDPEISSFLVIGAYRSNEVDESHRFTRTLERIKNANVPVTEISLTPLSETDVNTLISSFMRCDKETSLPLAEIVHKKTGGNPFFVNMFVKTLYEENLLLLDFEYGWTWEIDDIKKMPLTDNVADIIVKKITSLPDDTQAILKICACIGNRFDIQTIAHISEKSIDEALAVFSTVIEEGFVYLSGDTYFFQHDHIQAAVYTLLSENDKVALHYRIGKYLLENLNEEELQDKIIYIVDQLNACRSLVASPEERLRIAELNLRAGRKARTSAAYESALAYFKVGIALSENNCWESNYDLSLTLHTEAAEAAYLNTQYDEFQYFSGLVVNNAKTLLDRVKVYGLQILVCAAENKPLKAVQLGVKTLEMLGIRFPSTPRIYDLLFNLLKTKFTLHNKTKDELADIPGMEDPVLLAAMRIISNASASVYYASPNLFPLIVFKNILLSIKHGNPPQIPYFYAGYGVILSSIGDIDNAYEFGKFGIQLLDKLETRDQFCRTHFVMNCFIRHWKEHIRNTIKPFILGSEVGFETGDIEFVCHNLLCWSFYSFYSGCELTEFEKISTKYSAIISQFKQKTQFYTQTLYLETMRILQGRDEYSSQMVGSVYNEEKLLPLFIDSGDRNNTVHLYLNKMILNYFFDDHLLGLNNSEKAKKDLDCVKGTFVVVVFNFFDSLLRLALYSHSSNKKDLIKQVVKNQKKMKKWAHHAPMNHLHKYTLVEAELNRVLGKDSKAIKLFDTAIKLAGENQFIQEEALANELSAKFYLSRGHDFTARAYMNEACERYQKWGASAKVRDLKKKNPGLLIEKDRADKDLTGTVTAADSTGNISKRIDLSSVLKSYQAISGEIVFFRLVEKLMNVVIENAGAQKGYLLLKENHALIIKAGINVEDGSKIITMSMPLAENDDLSHAVVNYVERTLENVVLSDAVNEGDYTWDPYIRKNRPCSILCIPIIRHNALIGVLYLENNRTTGAFTLDRIEMLRLLSSQIAISIDNAGLYNDLSKSEERYRTIIESIEDAYAEFNLDGDLLFFNDSLCRLTGYTREELTGMNSSQFITKKDHKAVFNEFFKVYKTGIPMTLFEFEAIAKDGKKRHIQISISLLRDANNKRIGYQAVGRDITLKKQAEIELKKARETAEATSITKSEFLANISHEIRTPLNSIIGFTDLAQKTDSFDNIDNYIENTRRSAGSLLEIVDEILEYSRIEKKELSPSIEQFDLSDVLGHVKSRFDWVAHDKGIDFKVMTDNDVPKLLTGDPAFLSRALKMLVGNAVKFTDHGSVVVNIAVLDRDDPEKIRLNFSITDTGIGIAEDKISSLFRPFTQEDGSLTRRHGGTGLGLAICRHLIEMMGGKIRVESRSGRGSTFSFNCRFGYSKGDSEQRDARQSLRGAKVLIVEDNPVNQQLIGEILKNLHIKHDIAGNGQEGLNKALTANYDAVLMDIQMPVMDGYEATMKLRQDNRTAELPIIALTAHVMDKDREKCLDAGMNDYLIKPINVKKMLSSLCRWVKPREKAIGINDFNDQACEDVPDRAEEALLPDSLPGIDLGTALDRIMGNKKVLTEILNRFALNYKDIAEKINTALKEDDPDNARKLAHTIKGVAGNISATRLYEAASELEQAIGQREEPRYDTLMTGFIDALGVVMKSIEDLNKIHTERPEDMHDHNDAKPDLDVVVPLMKRLKGLMQTNNIESEACFEKIKAELGFLRDNDEIKALEHHLSIFDFKSAVKNLDLFMDKISPDQ